MADSDDESSVASEDWHHEFDDYHSQAAADIYKMIYKSWPKRGHSWNRDRHVQFYAAVSSMLRHLPEQTTSQLDFLDGLADKINAHRAYLRQQLSPRPRRRGAPCFTFRLTSGLPRAAFSSTLLVCSPKQSTRWSHPTRTCFRRANALLTRTESSTG